ncbi:MAG: hypothetical protein ACRD3W_14845 [Terriglobales bacterium]
MTRKNGMAPIRRADGPGPNAFANCHVREPSSYHCRESDGKTLAEIALIARAIGSADAEVRAIERFDRERGDSLWAAIGGHLLELIKSAPAIWNRAQRRDHRRIESALRSDTITPTQRRLLVMYAARARDALLSIGDEGTPS